MRLSPMFPDDSFASAGKRSQIFKMDALSTKPE
jgi:hypothetical protein